MNAPTDHVGDAALPTASAAATRRAVGDLLAPQRRPLFGALAVVVLGTAASLCVPPILGAITETVVDAGTARRLDALAALLLGVVLIAAVLGAWGRVLVGRLGEGVLAELREHVVGRALHLPLDVVERAGTGDLVTRVGNDVDDISRAVREALPELLAAVLTIGLTLVGLALLDWRLVLAGVAAVPIHVAATRWYLRRAGPLYAAERIAGSRRAEQITETVSAADTVRAFRLAPRRAALAGAASAEAMRRSLRAARTGARFFACLNMAELVGTAATLAVGFLAVRGGHISIGAATAAALYFHGLFNPIGALLTLLDTAQDAVAALARLVGITDIASPTRSGDAEPGDASVVIDDVSFGYRADRIVVDHLDLVIGDGEQVALVGTSGAGKSTVAKLVAGIHEPLAGAVLLGGKTRDELAQRAGAQMTALVTQDVHTFAGTVADNLRLASPDATDDDLRTALRAVGADAWTADLPDGLGTRIGEGARPLTADLAQLLALARLWLSPARIVVLDEATAEAGSAGARRLEAAARAAVRGRTAIVIAHRLTQAAAADRIVVLAHGRITEEGTHEELLAAGGAYAASWRAWAAPR